MRLREYQTRALDALAQLRADGTQRILLVAPTGAGKGTLIAHLLAAHPGRALCVAHRREIILDLVARVDALVPGRAAPLLADEPGNLELPVQIASVQTLLSRALPAADLIILDEAHHYRADEWSTLLTHYRDTTVLGFTATPERADGRPMGDAFSRLLVVASYSELIRDGYLVDCRVFQPPEILSRALAQEPAAAYLRYAVGTKAFCYVAGVQYAHAVRATFLAADIRAEVIDADTPLGARADHLAAFRAGIVRVIVNVYTMTEGIDVPSVESIILARGCQHVSTYLQIVGRALRPAPGKTSALLLDLTGASLKYGLPTQDRVYSLDGRAIRSAADKALCVCPRCGLTFIGTLPCPECGYKAERVIPPPRIYSLALREVYAGVDTPPDAKFAEWARLRALAISKGWSLSWARQEYVRLFSVTPPMEFATEQERRYEFERHRVTALERGYKPGYARARYHATFGEWPPRQWR